jgi:N-acetylglucosamine-6-sulfatase
LCRDRRSGPEAERSAILRLRGGAKSPPRAGGAGGTRRRGRSLGGAALTLAAIAAGTFALGAPASGTVAPPQPNFLVVLVDDQADNTFKPAWMPETYRWIVHPGTKFTNGLAAPPLCCPDRAGILTGQYPHNNGVFSNDPGYASLNGKHDTLPRWLHRAGYRTGFVGKFLNQYSTVAGNAGAPGFDDWFGFLEPPGYYHYAVSDNGTPESFGDRPADYSTDVLTRHAKGFVRESASDTQPFFLWLAYHAPHDTQLKSGHCGGSAPLPANDPTYQKYRHVPLPNPPSFNEADVSDKPSSVASLPSLEGDFIVHLQTRYRCTLAAMHEVDKEIGKLMASLKRNGELDNTIVFYLSDNGFFFGEHRITRGKSLPYEPALRVPYAVRVPKAYQDQRPTHENRHLVTNEDVAPTILDYAGGVPSCATKRVCRILDGRSLRPLVGGSGRIPADRGVLSEISTDSLAYSAIRTRDDMYAQYPDGERELYDLKADPWELQNIAGTPAAASVEQSLAARLRSLRRCSGIRGRDPKRSGTPFCE